MPKLFLLLSEAATPPNSTYSWEAISMFLLALFGGAGVLASIIVFTVRGYWSKNIAPLIQEEVQKWFDHTTQKEAREKERATALKAWFDHADQRDYRERELQHLLRSPTMMAEQEIAVKKILDTEIKRTDGLISREIQTQVSDMETRLMSKLEEVVQFLREDTASKQQLIQRMAKLEGAIHALLPYKSSDSSSSLPAAPNPPPPTPKSR